MEKRIIVETCHINMYFLSTFLSLGIRLNHLLCSILLYGEPSLSIITYRSVQQCLYLQRLSSYKSFSFLHHFLCLDISGSQPADNVVSLCGRDYENVANRLHFWCPCVSSSLGPT